MSRFATLLVMALLLIPASAPQGLAFARRISIPQSGACPAIRLDQGDGPVAPLPIYDQKDRNICYAIAASELVDAYRFSSPSANREEVSSYLVTAAHFSSAYREALNKMPGVSRSDGLELGSTYWAILALRKKGSCDRNRLFTDSERDDIDREFSDLNRSVGRYKRMTDPNCGPFYRCADEDLTEACGPYLIPLSGLPEPRYVPFGNALSEKTRLLQSALQETLAQPKAQPIGVDFCMETMLNDGFGDLDIGETGACTQHSALIVGSRPTEGGGCEVLVRDSGGPQCDPRVAWPCDSQKPGEYWIPLTKLAARTLDVTYFKPF